ncbi:hypothetical protein Pcinc_011703 [Petrolisthes cinctipes]|uniref:Uncharacterized protein n=1 Tax=Petrolisthes cinctipes TaxID=88211 RepID=A0AAE1KW45_PETCI|nr:hypothetical protein Pcinc_011703 [Petrolisthes cinctipes]
MKKVGKVRRHDEGENVGMERGGKTERETIEEREDTNDTLRKDQRRPRPIHLISSVHLILSNLPLLLHLLPQPRPIHLISSFHLSPISLYCCIFFLDQDQSTSSHLFISLQSPSTVASSSSKSNPLRLIFLQSPYATQLNPHVQSHLIPSNSTFLHITSNHLISSPYTQVIINFLLLLQIPYSHDPLLLPSFKHSSTLHCLIKSPS